MDIIMLDNFTKEMMREVEINAGRSIRKLWQHHLRHYRRIRETGVDYISVGALTSTESDGSFDSFQYTMKNTKNH